MGQAIFQYSQTTEKIHVNVIPFYLPEKSEPEEKKYFYAYKVKITNNSGEDVQLLSRKWVIRDGNGTERVVSGEGVLGKMPFIKKGSNYEYTSFCPLRTTTGNMRGKFEMIDSHGEHFWITIPLFFLRHPITFQ